MAILYISVFSGVDLRPLQYSNKNAVDNENISSRYFPLPTAHHHHIYKGERKIGSNKVKFGLQR